MTFSRIEIETRVRIWREGDPTDSGLTKPSCDLTAGVTVSRMVPGRMEKDIVAGIENLNADVNLAVRRQLHLTK